MDKIKQFFRDVWAEVKKVSYPSKDELVGSTWVVIASVFISSAYLGIIDSVLSQAVRWILRANG